MGRTGTFIAVDWLMQEARVNKTIDIFSTILRLREYRVSMVQSEVILIVKNIIALLVM